MRDSGAAAFAAAPPAATRLLFSVACAHPTHAGSFLAARRAGRRLLLLRLRGCAGGSFGRAGPAVAARFRDLDRDPILLRVLRNAPFGLQLSDEILQNLTVGRRREGLGTILWEGPHQVFRRRGRGRRSSATPAPTAAPAAAAGRSRILLARRLLFRLLRGRSAS